MSQRAKQPTRYDFFLSPYSEERFVSCPRCDGLTEQRKFPLVIHVDPRNPVAINKTCVYCPRCDLIIARKDELEAQLAMLLETHNPDLIGNDYLVLGTLDHDDWDRGRQTPLSLSELLDKLFVFQDVLRIQRADPKLRRTKRRSGQARPKSKPARTGRKSRSPQVAPAKPPEIRPGREDPCWCGSGKKFKDCHLGREPR